VWKKGLMTWKKKTMTKIHGQTHGNGYWRIKINEEIYYNFKYPDTVIIIKGCRLEWLGHIVRMGGEWTVKSYWKENRAVTEKKELG
jgi:hypothetical protein